MWVQKMEESLQKYGGQTCHLKTIILFTVLHLFFCGSRRLNRDYGCLVWLSVDLCVVVVTDTFKSQTENIRQVKDGRLRWGGVGFHNEWHIVKSLPTKQSLLPCKWEWLDKDLFDRTHAEYEAVNSLISIPQGWLAKTRVSQPESVPAKPNIDLFNGVRESGITNLLSIVYEAV